MAKMMDINIGYVTSPLCSFVPITNVEEIAPVRNKTSSESNTISIQPTASSVDMVSMDVDEENPKHEEEEIVVSLENNEQPSPKVVRRSSRRHKETQQELELAGTQNYMSMLGNVEWLNQTLVNNPLFFSDNKATAINMRTAARSLQLKSSGKKDDLATRLSQYGRALQS